MDAAEYFDDFAAYYDAYYESQLDGSDVEFYRDRAVDADGPVLEVGCGTGRVYLELLRSGVDADGIDVSSEMLTVLREKAAAADLEPRVRTADVTEFDAEREYALVIVPFRAFLHLTDVEDQLAALKRIHDALAPDGRLVLNVFAPNFEVICDRYGRWETEVLEVGGSRYLHRSVTELVDEVEQVARIRTEVVEITDRQAVDGEATDPGSDDGEVVLESETPLALLSKREFELLFRLSPFSSWSVSGGFDGGPLESTDQEMIWIAGKRPH